MKARESLVRLLVRLGVLEEEPQRSVYDGKAELPIRLLSKQGRFDEREAVRCVAEHLDIVVLDLECPETKAKLAIGEYECRIDTQLCWEKKMVPLWEDHGGLSVAMANPVDLDAFQRLCFALEVKGTPVAATEREVMCLLREHIPPSRIQFDTLDTDDEAYDDAIEILTPTEANELTSSLEHSEVKPVIRLCNKLVADAYQAGVSDIHLQPTDGSLDVRFRIDGVLHSIMEVPHRLQAAVISRMKLLSGMDIADHRSPQDGRFGVQIDGHALDVRVSCVPTGYGENVVLRLLSSESSDLTFDHIGLPPDVEQAVSSVLAMKGKMFLVTGPTGSGKTTTLYTCLNRLRNGTCNIETVEDPIEYRVPGVQQIQVHESAGVTFASALRAILRQDPDVIMIGEIRDEETAKIALQSAQTGHLVLSTLHTNDALAAITRLYDLNAPPYLISSSLAGVIAQRLVRTVCPECEGAPGAEYLDRHAHLMKKFKVESEELVVGAGCKACHYTGFRGRAALYSYLEVGSEVEQLIHDQASAAELEEVAREYGYRTLEEEALAAVRSGRTTFDEVAPYLSREHRAPTQIVEELALELEDGESSGPVVASSDLVV
ncbi:GspE/PulE family protein [bacterium]|nr:GspE/PulE family protein [bacterium]